MVIFTADGYLPDEDFSTPDGEVYEVKLRKINNSLGLNVAVSLDFLLLHL